MPNEETRTGIGLGECHIFAWNEPQNDFNRLSGRLAAGRPVQVEAMGNRHDALVLGFCLHLDGGGDGPCGPISCLGSEGRYRSPV